MIKIIGFDADDTLWHNESIFDRAQQRYRSLLEKYHPAALTRLVASGKLVP